MLTLRDVARIVEVPSSVGDAVDRRPNPWVGVALRSDHEVVSLASCVVLLPAKYVVVPFSRADCGVLGLGVIPHWVNVEPGTVELMLLWGGSLLT